MASPRTWQHVDTHGERTPASISAHIKLSTPPNTDIWRPSATEDRFNAPFIYTALPSSTFTSVRATISSDWKTLYDQGGLLLVWPCASDPTKHKWVKLGIEYFTGKPLLGVVGCDRYADWSVCPLPMAGATHATLEAVREGTTLWVYLVFDEERRPLREIKWAFLEEREAEAEMWVGVYAAKPTVEEGDERGEKGIEVVFRDFELQTKT